MAEHYFSKKPTSKKIESTYQATVAGLTLTFTSASGVFSKEELDTGSRVLIENALILPNQYILDLGCGIGVIGIFLAKAFAQNKFLLSDINERAVELAKKNIKTNKVKNATAIQSDGFENIKESFDAILLNPPQTAGRKLCEGLISQSKDHLKPGGRLQIVARHQKGGKAFMAYMKSLFGNVTTLARKSGYHVYMSKR